MQAAKKGVFNVFYGLLGQIITICLGIVIPRLVLVSYGSEVNGLLNSANQIFVYFGLFEAGIGLASMQALYAPVANGEKENIQGILSATHQFYRKTGVLYALAVTALAFLYPLCVKTEISYWLVVGIILFGGMGNCINFLYQGKYKILMQAEGYTYVITNITTVINIASNIVKVVLLLRGGNVLTVQFAFFMMSILQMGIYYVYVHRHYGWLNLSVEPNTAVFSQTKATLIHQVSSMVFSNTDVLLLTLISQNLKIVSIYTMYNMIVTMVTTMIQQISSGFDFRLGQMYNTDRDLYFVLHHIFEIVYLILVFTAMTVVYLCIYPFMRLYTMGVSDINYLNRWYPLLFVMVPLLTYGRTSVNNLIVYAGHFKKTQWRAVAESVINIVVSLVGIWKLGIFGALLGTIVASLYRTNDMIFYTYKHLIHRNPWTTYRRWAVCFIVFGIVVRCISIDNPAMTSYGTVILYGCIYGAVFATLYTVLEIIVNPKESRDLYGILKGYIGGFLARRK